MKIGSFSKFLCVDLCANEQVNPAKLAQANASQCFNRATMLGKPKNRLITAFGVYKLPAYYTILSIPGTLNR